MGIHCINNIIDCIPAVKHTILIQTTLYGFHMHWVNCYQNMKELKTIDLESLHQKAGYELEQKKKQKKKYNYH